MKQGTRRVWERDLTSQFRSVEQLLGAKRAEMIARLQRMRFGQSVSIELIGGGRIDGFLRGCNGVRAVLIDGTSVAISRIRDVTAGVDEMQSREP
jgi:hypothetical protein